MNKYDRIIMQQMDRLREPNPIEMICPECGEYMDNSDLFDWSCPECGYSFTEEYYEE